MLNPTAAEILEQRLFEHIEKTCPDNSLRKATQQMVVPLVIQALIEYEKLKSDIHNDSQPQVLDENNPEVVV